MEPAPRGPTRLLIVDDSAVFRSLVTRMLAGDSALRVVGVAADGETALKLADELTPDLVLMDVLLPQRSGLEVTRLLKGKPQPPRIVAVSVYDGPEVIREAEQAGADVFLSKFDLDQLLTVLRWGMNPPQ